jgi:hypothetical protein
MKLHLVLLALAVLPLAGCARDGAAHSYAGNSGSTYDAAANPAQAHGAASYDPASKLTPRDYGNSGQPAKP